MGQESSCHSTECLWLQVSPEIAIRCHLGLQAHLKAQLNNDSLPTVGKTGFLMGCWMRVSIPCWPLARDLSQLPHGLSIGQGSTWQLASLRESTHSGQNREAQGRSHSTLCNLILEVTPHYFCHVLFIRSKSKGPAHTQKENITKGSDCQESEITGAF